ncbi:hypothetical protein HPP92_014228 [Vanilla planifolia]|uniref:Xyloglucan endotransglucosylase/hydrolase n=1 Tax=Vanilla planifolia TaxID=51239 RepID=A0A835QTF6_VANPL|nr:hypothetical protein HPP92_014663 [Vanilla planifolia]KAG0474542.1 hypothetical protein HPP92_014228 [Vanilla planifolia]
MATLWKLAAAGIMTVVVLSSSSKAGAFNLPTISFDEGYTPLFGESNIVESAGGRKVKILLNKHSGSGFISSDIYYHGMFSASIKLPSDYTAGVVVAFYMSNGDIFEKNHDELDFEFLGNIRGGEWRIQTNVYGNGSTSRGREERYQLPFDPTAEPHRYSILWTNATIIFYIDDTPIREVVRNVAMGGDYPSKPMSVYATIWDGSTWATSNGKYKVNYKYAPFVAHFSDLVLHGCRLDPIWQLPAARQCGELEAETATAEYSLMTPAKRRDMLRFRQRYMTYTCCYDQVRYPEVLPECEAVDEAEKEKYWKSGDIKVQPKPVVRRHRLRRRNRAKNRIEVKEQQAADQEN